MVKFEDVLDQTLTILEKEHRVSYLALKRRLGVDDSYIEDLKEEIIVAKKLARDENGRVLVWHGAVAEPVKAIDPPVPDSPRPRSRRADEAERRQITVMFCDLADSTRLAEELGPEQYRELLQDHHGTWAQIIARFGGHVAQYLGDGLLVYFGYPHAHEDSAQRSVECGLEIIRRLKAARSRRPAVDQSVRIGIHTGIVVISEIGDSERFGKLAFGESPNIAARLQSLAPLDTVVLADATYRLVHGRFQFQSLGSYSIKGISRPIEVYQVIERVGAQARFEVGLHEGLTPLVGRQREMARLLGLWEKVENGSGGSVFLSGEAGIGKTRLVQELISHVRSRGFRSLHLSCSPYSRQSTLFPVIEALQRILRFHKGEAPAARLKKLRRVVSKFSRNVPDDVTLLAMLLDLPHANGEAPAASGQRLREKIYEALIRWPEKEAERFEALLVFWEDLHWADPTSLELIGRFLSRSAVPGLLTIFTFRPEFVPEWENSGYTESIHLSGLDSSYVERIIRQLTDHKGLPEPLVHELTQRTDGVPLYVEELTKTLLESGHLEERQGRYEIADSASDMTIPPTLHDSLMSRLDRLGVGKLVAQLGSVVGREFSDELIRSAWDSEEEDLDEGLRQLVEANLVQEHEYASQRYWVFRHALIRDTAYQNLLRNQRSQHHKRIATCLEATHPEMAASQPEVLAYHYSQGKVPELAIELWFTAGKKAIRRSANVEAISQLQEGLALLRRLPEDLRDTQQELDYLIALGGQQLAVRGYAAPEVGQVFQEARDLCRMIGDSPPLYSSLQGLWMYHLVRGDLEVALELAEHLKSMALELGEEDMIMEAFLRVGISLSTLGQFPKARTWLEKVTELYDLERHQRSSYLYGQDTLVSCLCHLSTVLWFLGHPEKALERSYEALDHARRLQHPFSQSWALLYVTLVHYLRREADLTERRATELVELCEEHGFSYRLAQGHILLGWALSDREGQMFATRQIRQGISAVRATGAEVYVPFYLALLAQAHQRSGEPVHGLSALSEARNVIDQTAESFFEAEIQRLEGELILSSPDAAGHDAAMCFMKALETARRQGAKSLELRAATSLAEEWLRHGRTEEARQLLSKVRSSIANDHQSVELEELESLLSRIRRPATS